MRDLRFALRSLLRQPAFAIAAVLALALGIGATTVVFTVIRAVVINPIPFAEPDALYFVRAWSEQTGPSWPRFSGADVLAYRERVRGLEHTVATVLSTWNLQNADGAVRLIGARVSPGFFETLRLQPVLGRLPEPGEYRLGRQQLAVLGHGAWMRQFGGDPAVLGSRITMDSEVYQVIGVMPPGFEFPRTAELWAPLPLDAIAEKPRYYELFGRLRPGVAPGELQAELAAIGAARARELPRTNTGLSARAVSFREEAIGPLGSTLLVFSAAVALVLLIACANVANLVLARAESRSRELAVRSAIGAARGRLIRHLMAENLVLALAGGALGALLAWFGVPLLVRLDVRSLPRAEAVRVDGGVLLFAIAAAAATALLFGGWPAWRTSLVNLNEALRAEGRGVASSFRRHRFRPALVVAEVALGCLLLTGAGLLIRSLSGLLRVEPGFRADNLLTMMVMLSDPDYQQSETRRLDYFDALLERLRAIPGVQSAGAVSTIPLYEFSSSTGFWLDDGAPREPVSRRRANFRVISPGYLETMGIPLRAGRIFDRQDRSGRPRVALVNQEFERRWFPGTSAVGRRLTLDFNEPLEVEIVGVTGDVRQSDLALAPEPEVLAPHAQIVPPGLHLVLRSGVDRAATLAAVRAQMRELDPRIPVFDVRSMDEVIASSLAQPRMRTTLLSVFAGLALALAALGIYGVLSYVVTERRREIGVRLAVGARPRDVVRMMLGEGLSLAGLGVLLGLAGAAALVGLLRRFLFGVQPLDPLTFVIAGATLLLVAVLASAVPAWRATRVDPAVTLRAD
jgi:putative ABC transport system permease protein